MPRFRDFIKNLKDSRLVSSARLNAILEGHELGDDDDPSPVAKELVRRGWLTRYQANKLLNGRTWGFFLSSYRILKRLGEGGMGKVYLACSEDDYQSNRTDEKLVAIKVLPPRVAAENDRALKRFYREMELSQRLVHPNLTRTIEVGVLGDAHYMVMEYVRGDSLYNVVKKVRRGNGPLQVPDAAEYFRKVLGGLQAAHDGGLIHRDLKPSNLMITPDGDAKILDLGLAKAVDESNPLTEPNAVVGTLDYASPEQLANATMADHRSDLYSIGCTIYFALSGHPPFEGGDIVSKIFRHRMEDPPLLESVAPSVPSAFAAIVRKLMSKEPDDRYQSAQELADDLARWTDPDRVKALQGSSGGDARAFRPPPPELEDEEIRLDRDGGRGSDASLQTLFSLAEAKGAPMGKAISQPRQAILLDEADIDYISGEGSSESEPSFDSFLSNSREGFQEQIEMRWILRFCIAIAIIGILAIIVITLR